MLVYQRIYIYTYFYEMVIFHSYVSLPEDIYIYLLDKMVIFHSYVSLPEDIYIYIPII